MHKEDSAIDRTAIEALYRISQTLHETTVPALALQKVLAEVQALFPGTMASAELLNPDTNQLETEASVGFPPDEAITGLKLGQGLTGWVALHGRPVRSPDVLLDPRYIQVCPQTRSELVVPMLSGSGEVLGVLNLESPEPDAFSAWHEQVFSLVAGETSRVLTRLWQFDHLRRTSTHLEVLIDIARSLVTKRELGDLLQTIVARAREIIPCRLSVIFLRKPHSQELVLSASHGPEGPLPDSEVISLEESAIGTAFRRRKTIEVLDLPKTEEHHFPHHIQAEGLVSMLACPIEYEGEAIGVLNIYTDYPHRFDDAEKRIFETLASLSAAAILNARLYQRIFNSEEVLRRSERLTTLGLLSAEIAHEIRNPLTVIQLLFDGLGLEFDDGDPRQRDMTIIHEKLDQLNSIVSRVLDFGKSQQEIHSRFDLNKLVADTLHLVRLKLSQGGIELNGFLQGGPPPTVDVNKGQIQQAILNLLINASEALPGGGRIDVSTTTETVAGRLCAIVRVTDNGPGIDPGIQDAIFESFLTSRPSGTGLGLSIVKQIIKSHKGRIEVEKTGPDGTTMRIELPLALRPT
jgi:signal transduction histidine kinase